MSNDGPRVGDGAGAVRRGIAIAGGGAKGAYSFGCLKALAEAGISFQAVAATSAGALNGAILSTGAIDAGEALWLRMAPENSYELRGVLKRLPARVARVVLLAFVALRLYVGRFKYGVTIPEFDRAVGMVAALLTSVIAVLMIRSLGLELKLSLLIGLGAANPIALLYVGLSERKMATTVSSCMMILIAIGLFVVFAIYMPLYGSAFTAIRSIHDPVLRSGSGAVLLLALILAMPLTILGVPVLGFLGMRSFSRWLETVVCFSSAPLRETIRRFLEGRSITMPFFATVAQAKEIVDPDDYTWADTSYNPDADGEHGDWVPNSSAHWVPTYMRVDTLPFQEQVDVLTATAALPFGIVPSVILRGETFVDGGLADNDPIAPLLEMDLDEVWLVSLDPASPPWDTHVANATRLQRLIKIQRHPAPAGVIGKRPPIVCNEPPSIVPLGEYAHMPPPLELKPKVPLGNLFDGTLNFTPDYARSLIAQGYEDTRSALALLRVTCDAITDT